MTTLIIILAAAWLLTWDWLNFVGQFKIMWKMSYRDGARQKSAGWGFTPLDHQRIWDAAKEAVIYEYVTRAPENTSRFQVVKQPETPPQRSLWDELLFKIKIKAHVRLFWPFFVPELHRFHNRMEEKIMRDEAQL